MGAVAIEQVTTQDRLGVMRPVERPAPSRTGDA
jgi:hypothetical protein